VIKIKRCRCPKLLTKSNKDRIDYNKRKVVDALWRMQFEKCCYCEQSIPNEGHLKAVEHFKPKSIFKSLKNNWPNLLLACSQCNGKKSDIFPMQLCDDSYQPKIIWLKKDTRNRSLLNTKGKPLIINPSDPKINPEKEVGYIIDDSKEDWGQIIHLSEIGEMTIKIIDLTNPFHIKKRRTLYREKLYPAFFNLSVAMERGDPSEIKIKKDTFEDILKSYHEHSGFARAFARNKKMDINFGVKIPS
jgi:uncharacterized protein (TIGR02646 family)